MTDSKSDLRDDETDVGNFGDELVDYQYHASSDDNDSNNEIEGFGNDDAAAYDDGIEHDLDSSVQDVNGNNQFVIVNLECVARTDGSNEDFDDFDDLDSTPEALENEGTTWARSEENFNIHSNTRSVDGNETWISDDYEILSRHGTLYHLCRRCTYDNSMHDSTCQVCENTLVANPCPNVDALMANKILQKDHGSKFFQDIHNSDESQRGMIRKQASFQQTISLLTDSIDIQAMRLLQNVQNFFHTTGTIPSDLTSQLLSKPELHSLAATFIEHYLTYRSIFVSRNFNITLYYHATTATISSDLSSSTDHDHVAIQSIIQECRTPSRTMLLSKDLEFFVKTRNRNDGDSNTVALDESSAFHDDKASEHSGSSSLGVNDCEWMNKRDSDSTSVSTTSFRYMFVVATISVYSSHYDLIADSPDCAPLFAIQKGSNMYRSRDNPIPVLPLMCFDISQSLNTILNSHTRTFDYNGNRIMNNAEYMENHGFLYRGLDYVCSNFFARYSGN